MRDAIYNKRPFYLGLVMIILCGIVAVSALMTPHVVSDSFTSDNCWSIETDQSTGTINCWSGGKLVYSEPIYHNGGVLCTVDGFEIKTDTRKDFCVVESNQNDVWSPPTPELK